MAFDADTFFAGASTPTPDLLNKSSTARATGLAGAAAEQSFDADAFFGSAPEMPGSVKPESAVDDFFNQGIANDPYADNPEIGITGQSLLPVDEQVKRAWARGKESFDLDLEGNTIMWGDGSGFEAYDAKVKAKEEEWAKTGAPSLLQQPIVATAETLPGMMHSYAEGAKYGLAGLAIGGIAGGPVGAAALGKIGMTGGGAKEWFKQGAGQIYRDNRRAGASHEAARLVAVPMGALYAAAEFMFDLLPKGSGVATFAAAKPVIATTLRETSKQILKRFAIRTLGETSEEFVQQMITTGAQNITAALEKKLTGKEMESIPFADMLEQSTMAFVQALGPSAILGGPTTILDARSSVKLSKAMQDANLPANASLKEAEEVGADGKKTSGWTITGEDGEPITSKLHKTPGAAILEAKGAIVDGIDSAEKASGELGNTTDNLNDLRPESVNSELDFDIQTPAVGQEILDSVPEGLQAQMRKDPSPANVSNLANQWRVSMEKKKLNDKIDARQGRINEGLSQIDDAINDGLSAAAEVRDSMATPQQQADENQAIAAKADIASQFEGAAGAPISPTDRTAELAPAGPAGGVPATDGTTLPSPTLAQPTQTTTAQPVQGDQAQAVDNAAGTSPGVAAAPPVGQIPKTPTPAQNPSSFAASALKQRDSEIASLRKKADTARSSGQEEIAQRYEGMLRSYESVDAAEFTADVLANPAYYIESNIDPFLRFQNRGTNRAEPIAPKPTKAEQVKAKATKKEKPKKPSKAEALKQKAQEKADAVQKPRTTQEVAPSSGRGKDQPESSSGVRPGEQGAQAPGAQEKQRAGGDSVPAEVKPPSKAEALKKKVNKTSEPRAMGENGRPVDGKPVLPGNRFITATGRTTTPYPDYSIKRYTKADVKKANQWLIDNAIAEAAFRNDDFNLRSFKGEKADNLPPASIASMQLYLFNKAPASTIKQDRGQPGKTETLPATIEQAATKNKLPKNSLILYPIGYPDYETMQAIAVPFSGNLDDARTTMEEAVAMAERQAVISGQSRALVTDEYGTPTHLVSWNGKTAKIGTVEAAYFMGDVYAYEKDRVKRMQQGTTIADRLIPVDEEIAIVEKQIAKNEISIKKSAKELQIAKAHKKKGGNVKDLDNRFPNTAEGWTDYIEQREIYLDMFSIERAKEYADRLAKLQELRKEIESGIVPGVKDIVGQDTAIKAQAVAEPTPAPAQALKEKIKAKKKTGYKSYKSGTGTTNTIDAIAERGGLKSRTRTKLLKREAGMYDGAPTFAELGGFGKVIYNSAATQMPDQMAQSLYEDGLIAEPSPDIMWSLVTQEMGNYRDAKARNELTPAGQAKRAKKWAEERAQEEFQASQGEMESIQQIIDELQDAGTIIAPLSKVVWEGTSNPDAEYVVDSVILPTPEALRTKKFEYMIRDISNNTRFAVSGEELVPLEEISDDLDVDPFGEAEGIPDRSPAPEQGRPAIQESTVTSSQEPERKAEIELKGQTPQDIRNDIAAKEKKARQEELRKLAEKPIQGRKVDTTGDLFDADKAEAPLFAAPTPSGKAETVKESPKPSDKIDDFGQKIGGARKDAEITSSRSGEKKEPTKTPWQKQFIAAESISTPGQWALIPTKKTRGFHFSDARSQVFSSQAEAEAAIPLYAVAQSHGAYPNRDNQSYSIYKRVGTRKRLKVVSQDFASREDAMRYMAEHAVELLEAKTNFGEEILPVPEIAIRTGAERRTSDATPEMFMETFAPRAIEFGNWNNQAERQQVMNHAYDGLLDLADVLGVPPKALMLDGDLAIAFGARGQGLSGAKAHYERNYGVINLTKMKGAGSLAHEFFHALDHYLARLDEKASSEKVPGDRGGLVYKSQSPQYDMQSHGPSYNSKMREELKESYRNLIESLYRKSEKYVDDTDQAVKFIAKARDNLAEKLDRIRQSLQADQTSYSKKYGKPISTELLAEYDRLANILVEGGSLETKFVSSAKSKMGGWHSNETLDAIGAIHKAVRNRQGFSTGGNGPLNEVASAMRTYADRIRMLEEAKKGTEKTKKVATGFAIEAKKMDQARSGDYWGEPHEMVARAFSAYVEDKIAEQGGQSDFLVYHAHGGILLPMIDGFVARPYPEGAERIAINKMFDDFINTLETKTTDKGVAFFSKKDTQGAANEDIQGAEAGPRTLEEVGNALAGYNWVHRSEESNALRLLSRVRRKRKLNAIVQGLAQEGRMADSRRWEGVRYSTTLEKSERFQKAASMLSALGVEAVPVDGLNSGGMFWKEGSTVFLANTRPDVFGGFLAHESTHVLSSKGNAAVKELVNAIDVNSTFAKEYQANNGWSAETLREEFAAAIVSGREDIAGNVLSDVAVARKAQDAVLNALTGTERFSKKDTAQDAEYLAAVEAGDMETAQKMVDETAKKAGYNVGPVYRGDTGPNRANIYDPKRLKSAYDNGPATLFTDNTTVANFYGDARRFYLRMKNPLREDMTIDGNPAHWASIRPMVLAAQRDGRDGIILNNVIDGPNMASTIYGTLSSEQEKLADPVTYDDSGKVIPLSERFQTESPDIRYAKGTSVGITTAQAETAIAKVRAEAPGADIRVVATFKDLPAAIQRASRGQEGTINGVTVDGVAYVIASEVTSPEQAQEIAREEVAHVGLRQAFTQPELDKILSSTYGKGKYALLKTKIKRQYGVNEGNPLLIEELLAHVARDGAKNQTILQKFIAAIRDFFRRAGLLKSLSDNDIDMLVGKALAVNARSRGSMAEGTRFAVDKPPVFRSAMAETLDEKLSNNMTGKELGVILQSWSSKGLIKKEELDDSGLMEWAKQQDGKISKEEVLAELLARTPAITETVLGNVAGKTAEELLGGEAFTVGRGELEDQGLTPDQMEQANMFLESIIEEFAEAEDAVRVHIFPMGYMTEMADGTFGAPAGNNYALGSKDEVARDIAAVIGEDDPSSRVTPKFSTYTLPGGKNYKEILIQLPVDKVEARQAIFDKYAGLIAAAEEKVRESFGKPMEEYDRALANRDRLEALRDKEADAAQGAPNVFRSSHFDQPNIVAHLRMNEREVDGKKVLFLEEIQSDWHQAGRKKGYSGEITKEAATALGYSVYKTRSNLGSDAYFMQGPPNRRDIPVVGQETEAEAWDVALDFINKKTARVPDAPFKKAWPLLAFKRALRYAVDNGMSEVAWTTGEQQAERYDLSKQINEIAYWKQDDGKYGISILDKNNRPVDAYNPKEDLDATEIEDHVGKEMANKILNDEGSSESNQFPPESGVKYFSDLDLKIGGEGMKGFYDSILPSIVNKYAKRFGGKVSEITLGEAGQAIRGDIELGITSGDAVTDRNWVTYGIITGDAEEGFALSKQHSDVPASFKGSTFDDRKTLVDALQDELNKGRGSAKVHSLEITPEMQASIESEPQPRYSKKQASETPEQPEPFQYPTRDLPDNELAARAALTYENGSISFTSTLIPREDSALVKLSPEEQKSVQSAQQSVLDHNEKVDADPSDYTSEIYSEGDIPSVDRNGNFEPSPFRNYNLKFLEVLSQEDPKLAARLATEAYEPGVAQTPSSTILAQDFADLIPGDIAGTVSVGEQKTGQLDLRFSKKDREPAGREAFTVTLNPEDAYGTQGLRVKVIRNPDYNDYAAIKARFNREFPHAPAGSIKDRFTLDQNGNRYIWYSSDAVHSQIEPRIEERIGGPVNQNQYGLDVRFSKKDDAGLTDTQNLNQVMAELTQELQDYKASRQRVIGTTQAIEKKAATTKYNEKLAALKERLQVGKTLSVKEATKAERLKAQVRLEKKLGVEPTGKVPVSVGNVVATAFEAGRQIEKDVGRHVSTEFSIAKSLREMGKAAGAREVDIITNVWNRVTAVHRIASRMENTGDANRFYTKELKEIFGETRFKAMLLSTKYNMPVLIKQIQDDLKERAQRLYGRGINKQFARFFSDTQIEQKSMRDLTPESKELMQKWLESMPTEKNEIGVTVPVLNGLGVDTLRGLYEDVKQIVAASRMEQNVLSAEAKKSASIAASELSEEVRQATKNIVTESGIPRSRGIKGALVDEYATQAVSAQSMFGGKKSLGYKMYYIALKMADSAAKKWYWAKDDQFQALLKQEGVGLRDRAKIESEQKPVKIDGNVYHMTDSERMYFAALWQRPEARYKLLENGWILRRFSGTDNVIFADNMIAAADDILKTITPSEDRIVTGIVDIMSSFSDDANTVSRELYGINLFNEERYFGMAIERSTGPTDEELEQNAYRNPVLENVGFSKKTVAHRNPLKIGSIFGQFEEHAQLMSKYIAMTIPIRHVLMTLKANNGELSKAITTHFGREAVPRIKQTLRHIAGLEGTERSGIQKILSFFTGNVAKAILAWNPGSFLANRVGGSMLYASELAHINPALARYYLATAFRPTSRILSKAHRDTETFLMENGYLRDRWSYDLSRVYIPLAHEVVGKKPQGQFQTVLRLIQTKALEPMKHAEVSNAIRLFNTLVNSGQFSREQARQQVEDITRMTQNSSSALEDSPFIQGVRKSGLGGLFPFMSQIIVARNLAVRDWLDKDFLGLFYTMLGMMAASATAQIWGELRRKLTSKRNRDDEDKALGFLLDATADITDMVAPGSGLILDPIRATVMGYRAGGSMLIDRPIQQAVGSASTIIKKTAAGDEVTPEAMINLINSVGQLSGLPTGGILQGVKALNVALSEE